MMNDKQLLKIGNYTFLYDKKENLRFGNYDFQYHNETCTDDYFKKELVEEVSREIAWYIDEKGREVLSVYESIPTFDSGDREWNSYQKIYIIKENGFYTGIYLTGGYRLADVKVYQQIQCGDEKTKELFERFA